jgi:hypothetical protein
MYLHCAISVDASLGSGRSGESIMTRWLALAALAATSFAAAQTREPKPAFA